MEGPDIARTSALAPALSPALPSDIEPDRVAESSAPDRAAAAARGEDARQEERHPDRGNDRTAVLDGDPSGPAARWRALLAGTPREVLSRIVPGDPLGLRSHVARRLTSDALLLDGDLVHLRSLARCARRAVRYTGRPELAAWLDEIVAEAIDEVLQEESEGDHAGSTSTVECGAFASLAPPLGLEPEAMRAACAAFNRMAIEERSAFFDLVIHKRTLDELASTSGEGATEIARRARRALEPFLRAQAELAPKRAEPGGREEDP